MLFLLSFAFGMFFSFNILNCSLNVHNIRLFLVYPLFIFFLELAIYQEAVGAGVGEPDNSLWVEGFIQKILVTSHEVPLTFKIHYWLLI